MAEPIIRPETLRERIDEGGDYEISVDANLGWLSFSKTCMEFAGRRALEPDELMCIDVRMTRYRKDPDEGCSDE